MGKKSKKRDKTNDKLAVGYHVSDDEIIASGSDDAWENSEHRTWKADARIFMHGNMYASKAECPRDRTSIGLTAIISEFNGAWKTKKGRRRIEKEYLKAKEAHDGSYKDAFSDPRHLPRVDANFFRMFQLIERFVDDEKGREVQRKREKQMMRDELCDLRKAVWRYRAKYQSSTNRFKDASKHTYKELAKIADKQFLYYISSEDDEDVNLGDDERKAKMKSRAKKKLSNYMDGSTSRGSSSSSSSRSKIIQNVNDASDSEAAPKKAPKTPKKKKKKLRVVKHGSSTTTTSNISKKKKKKKQIESSEDDSSSSDSDDESSSDSDNESKSSHSDDESKSSEEIDYHTYEDALLPGGQPRTDNWNHHANDPDEFDLVCPPRASEADISDPNKCSRCGMNFGEKAKVDEYECLPLLNREKELFKNWCQDCFLYWCNLEEKALGYTVKDPTKWQSAKRDARSRASAQETKENPVVVDGDDGGSSEVACVYCDDNSRSSKKCATCNKVDIHHTCASDYCDDKGLITFPNPATESRITQSCKDCIEKYMNKTSEPPAKKRKVDGLIDITVMRKVKGVETYYAEQCDPHGSDPKKLINKHFIASMGDGEEQQARIIGKGVGSKYKNHYVMRYQNHFEEGGYADKYITAKTAKKAVDDYNKE